MNDYSHLAGCVAYFRKSEGKKIRRGKVLCVVIGEVHDDVAIIQDDLDKQHHVKFRDEDNCIVVVPEDKIHPVMAKILRLNASILIHPAWCINTDPPAQTLACVHSFQRLRVTRGTVDRAHLKAWPGHDDLSESNEEIAESDSRFWVGAGEEIAMPEDLV